jgi:signal peptidase I
VSADYQQNRPDPNSLPTDAEPSNRLDAVRPISAADAGSDDYELDAYPVIPTAQPPSGAADADQDVDADSDDAAASPKKHIHFKSFWREVLETVLLTIVIFFMVKSLIANFRIQGTSMEPNFHTGQLVLVNRAAYFHLDVNAWLRLVPGVKVEGSNNIWLFGGPKRGDVIVFEPPDAQQEDYIKRVIGLPGDKVEVRDGKVYVNGVMLTEPYIKEAPFNPFPQATVPPGNLFVMGDNRNGSRDSRSFGMLPVDLIVGKAMFVYWPFGKDWGPIPEVTYQAVP